MFEQVFASLPEGLATTPPGAALGALLEQVDPRTVSPHDAVTLARAWRRQLSHHEARFALAAREAALADPERPGGRREGYGEFCAEELRAALVESRTRVWKLLTQADTAIAATPNCGRPGTPGASTPTGSGSASPGPPRSRPSTPPGWCARCCPKPPG